LGGAYNARCVLLSAGHIDDNSRDIVGPTAFVGQIYEFDCRLGRRTLRQDARDLGIGDLIAQAIGAQEESVAWL